MRKTLLSLLMVLAVYVVCDPYPTTVTQPSHFNIVLDGAVAIDVPALKKADNTVILHYEVTNVSNGNHTMSVKAVLIDPVWGRLESSAVPFVFTKPGASGTPTGIKLSNQ